MAAVWWLLDGRYSPCWVPLGLTSSHWRAVLTDDCDVLIYWCGRKYSIFIGMLSLGCFPYSCTLWDSWYPGENGFRRDPAPLLSIPRDPQPMPASEASQGDLSGCCIETSRPYQFMLILLMLDLRISDCNFFWFLESRLSGNQSHVRQKHFVPPTFTLEDSALLCLAGPLVSSSLPSYRIREPRHAPLHMCALTEGYKGIECWHTL